MGNGLNPGPPLVPGDEFCPTEPPRTGDYIKAGGSATLAVLGGAAGLFAIAMATQRLWSFTSVLIGLLLGWAVHRAAGRRRSLWLGVMAAVATVESNAIGYGLLWLPFISPTHLNRQLNWEHFIMLAVGAAVAYRLAGPRTQRGLPTR